jgi:hypothetical protein
VGAVTSVYAYGVAANAQALIKYRSANLNVMLAWVREGFRHIVEERWVALVTAN